MFPALLLACAPPAADTAAPPYPLDDVLRYDHVQVKGTHNSYHVETTDGLVEAWRYTHAPLAEQLDAQGVRQVELDVTWDGEAHAVVHVPVLDEGTTCATLARCLSDLKGWSDDHPRHLPLFVLLELKDRFDVAVAEERLAALDDEVLSVWPEDRLVTPDLVRGDAPDLRTALEERGWPTLGTLRGRALLVLHVGGDWRAAYTDGLTTTHRPLFPDAMGATDLPVAAVHTVNDPFDPRLPAVVAAGHLVRTRADADLVEATEGDTARRDQALAVGAHFVSTDFPVPVDWTSYRLDLSPRCNPVTAPPECTAEAVEHLADLR